MKLELFSGLQVTACKCVFWSWYQQQPNKQACVTWIWGEETGSYHVGIHHEDGHLSVDRPLDLLPHDRVHLHDLVRQPVVVQEGSHLAAERAGLVLVEGQRRTSGSSSWDLERGRGGGTMKVWCTNLWNVQIAVSFKTEQSRLIIIIIILIITSDKNEN